MKDETTERIAAAVEENQPSDSFKSSHRALSLSPGLCLLAYQSRQAVVSILRHVAGPLSTFARSYYFCGGKWPSCVTAWFSLVLQGRHRQPSSLLPRPPTRPNLPPPQLSVCAPPPILAGCTAQVPGSPHPTFSSSFFFWGGGEEGRCKSGRWLKRKWTLQCMWSCDVVMVESCRVCVSQCEIIEASWRVEKISLCVSMFSHFKIDMVWFACSLSCSLSFFYNPSFFFYHILFVNKCHCHTLTWLRTFIT